MGDRHGIENLSRVSTVTRSPLPLRTVLPTSQLKVSWSALLLLFQLVSSLASSYWWPCVSFTERTKAFSMAMETKSKKKTTTLLLLFFESDNLASCTRIFSFYFDRYSS